MPQTQEVPKVVATATKPIIGRTASGHEYPTGRIHYTRLTDGTGTVDRYHYAIGGGEDWERCSHLDQSAQSNLEAALNKEGIDFNPVIKHTI